MEGITVQLLFVTTIIPKYKDCIARRKLCCVKMTAASQVSIPKISTNKREVSLLRSEFSSGLQGGGAKRKRKRKMTSGQAGEEEEEE